VYYNFVYKTEKALETGLNKDVTRTLNDLNNSLDSMGKTGSAPATNNKNMFEETHQSVAKAEKETQNNVTSFFVIMFILAGAGALIVYKLTNSSTSKYRRRK
jgi:hypothetical protein